jgi:hypothetical protein
MSRKHFSKKNALPFVGGDRVTEKEIVESFNKIQKELDMVRSDMVDIAINAAEEMYKSYLEFKIDLIKGNYADIQNDSASDMELGWNRAIDMVLEILER